jgi:hypothetical protein
MPTFDDPVADATEASAALRGLAHATRQFADPADTYPVIGDLLSGARSLRQVLDQLAAAHIAPRARAHDDAGNQAAGATSALAAADELHQAGTLLDSVAWRLDASSQHSGRIVWHPAPTVDETPAVRWISVVFLQGSEADEVLDLIHREGADAAIEHLAGFDYGEETVQAALENGYVYDEPPTGALDKVATRDVYTLTYNPSLGHVSLLREHGALPDPALLGIDTPTPALASTAASVRVAHQPARAGTQAAVRERSGDWFTRHPGAAAAQGRGLAL